MCDRGTVGIGDTVLECLPRKGGQYRLWLVHWILGKSRLFTVTVESVFEETHAQGCIIVKFDSTPDLPQAGIGKPQPATQREERVRERWTGGHFRCVSWRGGGGQRRGRERSFFQYSFHVYLAVNVVFFFNALPRLFCREHSFFNTLSTFIFSNAKAPLWN